MNTSSVIAYDLYFNKNWRILRKIDDATYVISHAVTQKVIAVYWTERNAFTTHHFNDNFTLDHKSFAVENWAFGVGKLLIARYEATQLWNNDSPETRDALLANMTTMETEVVRLAEKIGGDHGAIVKFSQDVLSESKDYESMTTATLYRHWLQKTEKILQLIPFTSQRIAKEAIGRKLPEALIKPFFKYSLMIVAYLHAYKHSYSFSETAVFIAEEMAEEVSKKDKIWALDIDYEDGSLQYFRALHQDEEKMQLVLNHLKEFQYPQRKLGQALTLARDYVREMILHENLTFAEEEANIYLTKCGFFDFFQKMNNGVSLCNLKLNFSKRERDMLLEIMDGKVKLQEIFEEILKLGSL